MCTCACLGGYAHVSACTHGVCECLWRLEESIRAAGAGVPGACELLEMGIGI